VRRPVLTLALALALAPSAAHARDGSAPMMTPAAAESRYGATLRSHVFHTLDGRPVSLASLAGEVVVINVWASWCQPCRRELPGLDALNRELASGPAGARGRVLAVSIDRDATNARRFAAERRLSLPIYIDGPEGLARRLDLDRIPTTLVLDRDGRIACVHSGGDAAGLAEVTSVARRLVGARTAAVTPVEGGNP
jgi:cytochrome c biogenesis protein CcmG, thiol:disulfide interchange protein DsbE